MREELNYRGVIICMMLLFVLPKSFSCKWSSHATITGITGNALPEDIDFFVSNGANHVVVKPLSRAKLMDVLNRFVTVAMAAGEEKE